MEPEVLCKGPTARLGRWPRNNKVKFIWEIQLLMPLGENGNKDFQKWDKPAIQPGQKVVREMTVGAGNS